MPKLIRITTVPMALKNLLGGQMRYMKMNGFDVIMVSADGKERDDLIAQEGCPHQVIPMTRKITPYADIRSLWKLYRYFKKEQPDIVHSHTPKAGMLAMLAARMAGIKIRIHTIAGLRFVTSSGMSRTILVRAEQLTNKWATHVWPNSQSILDYVKEHKLADTQKLALIGYGSSNGVNLGRFSPQALQSGKLQATKQRLQYDEKLTYLLTVGRVVKDKGIDELLQAFQRVYSERSDLRLILIGFFEDHLDPVSDEARKTLNEHPAIIHINWSDEVEYYMHVANMLVHPSYREGLPNVLLQAGAMHCPILCSRIEGNIDVVDDGHTGMIFDVKDAASLEQILRTALNHPNRLKTYAENLRSKIEQRFDQRFVQDSMKTKYLELLSVQ